MKYPLFLVFFFCSLTLIFKTHLSIAQTGPGGVGNSSNNILWLDANVFEDAGAISIWNDISGNEYEAYVPFSIDSPLVILDHLNGFPVLSFNEDTYLKIDNISQLNDSNVTVFVVAKLNSLTSETQMIFSSNHAGVPDQRRLFQVAHQYGSSEFRGTYRYASTNQSSTLASYNTNYNLLFLQRWGDTLNTAFNSSITASVTQPYWAPGNHNFVTIGGNSRYTNTNLLDGEISEIILYSDTLNEAQRIIIDNYLSSKYDLNISASGNDYYSYESTGHYYELFGVGQDSGQVHTEARGTGIVTFSNPTGLADEEFILSAHDNEGLTTNTSDVPSDYIGKGGVRLNHIWRVDKTAGIGTVDVSFDITGITLGQASNYELLISSDGDFSTATSHTTGLDYDSVAHTVSFTDVDFTAGDYYTLGNYGPYVNFAHLKRKHDGTYCEAREGVLYFQSTEEYAVSGSELDFVIYDKERDNVLDTTGANLEKELGDNRFVLDVSSLDDGEFYTLEVKNDKGEKRVLKFKKVEDE